MKRPSFIAGMMSRSAIAFGSWNNGGKTAVGKLTARPPNRAVHCRTIRPRFAHAPSFSSRLIAPCSENQGVAVTGDSGARVAPASSGRLPLLDQTGRIASRECGELVVIVVVGPNLIKGHALSARA